MALLGKIETCPICEGSGHIKRDISGGHWETSKLFPYKPCPTCNGSGKVCTASKKVQKALENNND